MVRSKGSRDNKKRKLGLKPRPEHSQKKNVKKPKSKNPNPNKEDQILFGSGSESDSPPSSPTRINTLLNPYTKPQLISFLLDAALSDPELRDRIRYLADSGPSHRNLFVYGLPKDATKAQLAEAFSPFGPIDDCSVIVDKTTGQAKGYGFVLFGTRSGAAKALKEPQKRVGSRMVSCQLASAGGAKPDGGGKVYVGNVPKDARPERLREFFGRFGEIESGPWGFNTETGKSRGYAIFVYKSLLDARKAVEEPHKLFEGHQLHCKIANAGAGEGGTKTPVPLPQVPAVVPTVPTTLQAMAAPAQQQPVFAAVGATQNLALLSQNPGYAALLAQNPLLAAAVLNPALVNANAVGGMAGVPYGGGAAAPSVPGAYSVGQGMGAVGLQGLQGYHTASSSQAGQTLGGMAGGAFGGFPSSFYAREKIEMAISKVPAILLLVVIAMASTSTTDARAVAAEQQEDPRAPAPMPVSPTGAPVVAPEPSPQKCFQQCEASVSDCVVDECLHIPSGADQAACIEKCIQAMTICKYNCQLAAGDDHYGPNY